MKFLVISDLHANLEALNAVMADCETESFDQILLLGDLIGYGADPNPVVDLVRSRGDSVTVVRGNHDKAAIGLESLESFNVMARTAAEWTGKQLTTANAEFIRRLPQGPVAVTPEFGICHGSPLDEDMYVLDSRSAGLSFRASQAMVTLFGHTHVPSCFVETRDQPFRSNITFLSIEQLRIEASRRYLINPGSVGQPRDGDPRAAYMVIHWGVEREVEWRRVEYDVEGACNKIFAAGLPRVLGERLLSGR